MQRRTTSEILIKIFSSPLIMLENFVTISMYLPIAHVLVLFCLKVKNYISLGGPHAGIASVPLCGVSSEFTFHSSVSASFLYTNIPKSQYFPICMVLV